MAPAKKLTRVNGIPYDTVLTGSLGGHHLVEDPLGAEFGSLASGGAFGDDPLRIGRAADAVAFRHDVVHPTEVLLGDAPSGLDDVQQGVMDPAMVVTPQQLSWHAVDD